MRLFDDKGGQNIAKKDRKKPYLLQVLCIPLVLLAIQDHFGHQSAVGGDPCVPVSAHAQTTAEEEIVMQDHFHVYTKIINKIIVSPMEVSWSKVCQDVIRNHRVSGQVQLAHDIQVFVHEGGRF